MTKQFIPVDCSRGAPMGRAEYGTATECEPRTVRVFKVRLDGDYDDGGAYWGCNSFGAYLYCATDGADYRAFVRATSRADAIIRLGIPCDRLIRGDQIVTAKRIRAVASQAAYVQQALRSESPIPGMTTCR
jgi:hypothetical protein